MSTWGGLRRWRLKGSAFWHHAPPRASVPRRSGVAWPRPGPPSPKRKAAFRSACGSAPNCLRRVSFPHPAPGLPLPARGAACGVAVLGLQPRRHPLVAPRKRLRPSLLRPPGGLAAWLGGSAAYAKLRPQRTEASLLSGGRPWGTPFAPPGRLSWRCLMSAELLHRLKQCKRQHRVVQWP